MIEDLDFKELDPILARSIHTEETLLDKMKDRLIELGYSKIGFKESFSKKISGKKYFSDKHISLYTYVYAYKEDRNNNDEVINSGPCLVMFLSGPGLRASFVSSIELTHIFNPTPDDINKMEEVVESMIVLLT